MTSSGAFQLTVLIVALALTAPLLGRWIASVFGGEPGERSPGDRFFVPIERLVYRCIGVPPDASMTWRVYAMAAVAFGAVNLVVLYALLRLQGSLPLNPTHAAGQGPALAFNTAASFVTGTNWQAYAGETSASHLAQMAGLVTAHLTAAAVGIAVGAAFLRALTRNKPSETIGNFWVDAVRATTRIMIPLAIVFTFVLVSQGAVQDLHGFERVKTLEGATQLLPHGPAASQEVTKALGTNGGGLFNAGSAHPLAVPNGFAALVELYLSLLIPLAFVFAFGRMARRHGKPKQGRVILAGMVVLFAVFTVGAMSAELGGNDRLPQGVDQTASATNPGGNLEGKEVRFGPDGSALTTVGTMGTTAGLTTMAVDSATPTGSGTALGSMLLGEISPGGVGTGIAGMLVYVLLAVFIAGLMVGRTPEYLGKRIGQAEIKLVAIAILVTPLTIMAGAAIATQIPTAVAAVPNPGPHGFTEIVYAYASSTTGNGSAMAGLGSNTPWYNTTLTIATLIGRFIALVVVIALAGLFARKRVQPATAGTLPTTTFTFFVTLLGTIVVIGGLAFLPALVLGPLAEILH
jgi:K+-transporting ATPase ATPase A chain